MARNAKFIYPDFAIPTSQYQNSFHQFSPCQVSRICWIVGIHNLDSLDNTMIYLMAKYARNSRLMTAVSFSQTDQMNFMDLRVNYDLV
jgi:hypothetical protein